MGEVVAVVHAKGTSERVRGKNLRVLGDRPLFCHAIANARRAGRVDTVYVDSEADQILAIGAEHGAQPLRRPADLATNAATGDDLALWQATALSDSAVIVQVVPTSPFVRAESIDGAIDLLLRERVDSVVGVRREPLYEWRDGRPAYFRADGTIPNSQELEPVTYETTGLYVNRTRAVLRSGRRVSVTSCAPYSLTAVEAIDIDTEEDFLLAELVDAGLRTRATASVRPPVDPAPDERSRDGAVALRARHHGP